MKKTENTPISKSANSNFGPWGWFIILFALLSFMFAGNLIVDGLNITVAAFTELRGWESGVLLSCSTVGTGRHCGMRDSEQLCVQIRRQGSLLC